MTSILFMTHAGAAGGAELKMIDLAESTENPSEVLLLDNGPLEGELKARGIRVSVQALPASAGSVRRESGLIGLLRAIPATLSMIRGIARRSRQFDTIVCFSQKSFVLAALAKPFARRPILWFMNDIVSTDHFNPLLVKFLTLLSHAAANHVIVNSEASLEAWFAAGGRRKRVSVIHPMIRADLAAVQSCEASRIAAYREKFGRGRPLVGMFGRISPWKGQDIFLRAIARVPGVNAVIAGGALFGEEQHERNLRQLTLDLGIEDRVTFAGHISDVPTLMSACDVVAHCSTAPEPFGRVIVESMFAGTPVIASDAGGAREIVKHDETGQLTPMSDVPALADAIRRYLEDPHWSRAIATKARAHAEESFSPAAMTQRFNEILMSA
ncbi:MAG: glycosyltransferase family 4 protein [Steroidobacteraceae bacterium]|nr:glycosyltransferase family 4 protein [Steroidobacteraceae bacterium]